MSNLDNRIEIAKIFNLLKISYPYIEKDRNPNQIEQMIEVYVQLLSDLDPAQLKVAALQLIAESRFFPTIAELRDRVLALKQVASNVPGWEQAWEAVRYAIRKYGYESAMQLDLHVFPDPHIEMAVRRIGWRDICMCDEDQLNTLRAQFRDVYNIIAQREMADSRLLPETRKQIAELAEKLSAGHRRQLPDGHPEAA